MTDLVASPAGRFEGGKDWTCSYQENRFRHSARKPQVLSEHMQCQLHTDIHRYGVMQQECDDRAHACSMSLLMLGGAMAAPRIHRGGEKRDFGGAKGLIYGLHFVIDCHSCLFI